MAKLRAACKMHVLGQMWINLGDPPITVRFLQSWLLLVRLLPLRLESGEGIAGFHSGASCQLGFRVSHISVQTQLRILLRFRHLLLCAMPRQLQIRQGRASRRASVLQSRAVSCELSPEITRFVTGESSERSLPNPCIIEVCDISTGGMRLKLTNTRRSMVFHIGQVLTGTVVREQPAAADSLWFVSDVNVTNVLVRDDWRVNPETGAMVRVKTTYLGVVFSQASDVTREVLRRMLYTIDPSALAPSDSDDLTLVANRAKGV
jgi:hypothetical protein